MRATVIGGAALGALVSASGLRPNGCDVTAVLSRRQVEDSPAADLVELLRASDIVVDVSSPPSGEPGALRSFERSAGALLDAERRAQVQHHVALSIVGLERLAGGTCVRAKRLEEELILASTIPCTIVRSTQFFESMRDLAEATTVGDVICLPHVLVQPVALSDVAETLGRVSTGAPVNAVVEVAGPERFHLDDCMRRFLFDRNDLRDVTTDRAASLFGAAVTDHTLLPGATAELGSTRFDDWLRRTGSATSPDAPHAADRSA